MTAEMFSDDAIGRVLDRIHDYGTWKLFSEVCIQVFYNFNVNCLIVHQDTSSVSVWGEYNPGADDPMLMNHGYSKDKRPDLKQFVLSLLCVGGNLPFHARILDGNSSDFSSTALAGYMGVTLCNYVSGLLANCKNRLFVVPQLMADIALNSGYTYYNGGVI